MQFAVALATVINVKVSVSECLYRLEQEMMGYLEFDN
jgi:hypothetical protein